MAKYFIQFKGFVIVGLVAFVVFFALTGCKKNKGSATSISSTDDGVISGSSNIENADFIIEALSPAQGKFGDKIAITGDVHPSTDLVMFGGQVAFPVGEGGKMFLLIQSGFQAQKKQDAQEAGKIFFFVPSGVCAETVDVSVVRKSSEGNQKSNSLPFKIVDSSCQKKDETVDDDDKDEETGTKNPPEAEEDKKYVGEETQTDPDDKDLQAKEEAFQATLVADQYLLTKTPLAPTQEVKFTYEVQSGAYTEAQPVVQLPNGLWQKEAMMAMTPEKKGDFVFKIGYSTKVKMQFLNNGQFVHESELVEIKMIEPDAQISQAYLVVEQKTLYAAPENGYAPKATFKFWANKIKKIEISFKEKGESKKTVFIPSKPMGVQSFVPDLGETKIELKATTTDGDEIVESQTVKVLTENGAKSQDPKFKVLTTEGNNGYTNPDYPYFAKIEFWSSHLKSVVMVSPEPLYDEKDQLLKAQIAPDGYFDVIPYVYVFKKELGDKDKKEIFYSARDPHRCGLFSDDGQCSYYFVAEGFDGKKYEATEKVSGFKSSMKVDWDYKTGHWIEGQLIYTFLNAHKIEIKRGSDKGCDSEILVTETNDDLVKTDSLDVPLCSKYSSLNILYITYSDFFGHAYTNYKFLETDMDVPSFTLKKTEGDNGALIEWTSQWMVEATLSRESPEGNKGESIPLFTKKDVGGSAEQGSHFFKKDEDFFIIKIKGKDLDGVVHEEEIEVLPKVINKLSIDTIDILPFNPCYSCSYIGVSGCDSWTTWGWEWWCKPTKFTYVFYVQAKNIILGAKLGGGNVAGSQWTCPTDSLEVIEVISNKPRDLRLKVKMVYGHDHDKIMGCRLQSYGSEDGKTYYTDIFPLENGHPGEYLDKCQGKSEGGSIDSC